MKKSETEQTALVNQAVELLGVISLRLTSWQIRQTEQHSRQKAHNTEAGHDVLFWHTSLHSLLSQMRMVFEDSILLGMWSIEDVDVLQCHSYS